MGTCLSKKKQSRSNEASPTSSTKQTMVKKLETVNNKVVVVAASNPVKQVSPAVVPAPAEEKKPQLVKSQNKNCSITTAAATTSCPEDKESTKRVETPKKKSVTSTKHEGEKSDGGGGRVAAVEAAPSATVRTSSCTKEEVDAILIQCGRLSRSSSGKAAETPTRKRYSGSKRSYDFDEAARGGTENEDCEKQPGSRPSPRRRTPNRERSGDDDQHHHHNKRSLSRERGNSGGGNGSRRTSRSPGRRSEISDRSTSKQPAKMVSVPAREKGNGISGERAGAAAKRASSPTVVRSQSPAHTRASNENSYPHSLSRSNSRKAEQSPHRRNPMAELDDNSLGPHNKKASDSNVQARKPPENRSTETSKNNNNNAINNCVREQLMSCRAKEQPEIVEEAASKSTIVRSRSSRRSSRDLDNILGLSNSMFIEENNTVFSLPACVSKACSILEAVADLNFENKDHPPFLESEVVVKDDLMEPSIHKYVTVRGLVADLEPQESAGSNSFIIGGGQPWSSPWEPNSVESSDRCWTSANATGEEEEESSLRDQQQQSNLQESRGRRMRSVARSFSNDNNLPAGSATNGCRRRELNRHRSGGAAVGSGGRVGGRTVSVATGASS